MSEEQEHVRSDYDENTCVRSALLPYTVYLCAEVRKQLHYQGDVVPVSFR